MTNCDNVVIPILCNNQDVKLVQRRSQTTGMKGGNKFEGEKVTMCSGCRRANQGMIKIIR